MARTKGRKGDKTRGNKGRGGNKGIKGIRGKEACLKTDRGTGLIEGTQDFIGGLIY
jgi:hypothetical protein